MFSEKRIEGTRGEDKVSMLAVPIKALICAGCSSEPRHSVESLRLSRRKKTEYTHLALCY